MDARHAVGLAREERQELRLGRFPTRRPVEDRARVPGRGPEAQALSLPRPRREDLDVDRGHALANAARDEVSERVALRDVVGHVASSIALVVSVSSIALLLSASAIVFSSRGTCAIDRRGKVTQSSPARSASGFMFGCLIFQRPLICSTTSFESIRTSMSSTPRRFASSRPMISAVYSATLLVACPRLLVSSARTWPSASSSTAPAPAG